MILVQTYQELYYALQVLEILKESDKPLFEKLSKLIASQIEKLA